MQPMRFRRMRLAGLVAAATLLLVPVARAEDPRAAMAAALEAQADLEPAAPSLPTAPLVVGRAADVTPPPPRPTSAPASSASEQARAQAAALSRAAGAAAAAAAAAVAEDPASRSRGHGRARPGRHLPR